MQFLDLKKQYKIIKKEINKNIQSVLDEAVFIGGEQVEKFENAFAKFCGTRFAVSLNSGTDALYLALRAINIGPGDEVITSSFTFIATADAIANLGAKPVFVDINPRTFNIDAEKIEARINSKTKAIIPVHIFGQMADMGKIMRIAKKHNLFAIEDAAQAAGAEYKKNKAGSVGDLGCFSFFPSKNLGAYGDGGMIVTNNQELALKIRLLKSHGSSPKEKYLHTVLGLNSRLDSLQASILNVKLKYLPKWNRARLKIARHYNKNLEGVGDIRTPAITEDHLAVFHQYTIRTEQRDSLRNHLEKRGIPTMIYYPLGLHLQPALKYLDYKAGDFPETEKITSTVLSLPIYPELKRTEQDKIIKEIKSFFSIHSK